MLVKTSILAAFLGLVAACTKPNPVSCADGYCQDPAFPFCDVDGALEGNSQTCIAVDCTPGDVAGCRADNALVCNAGGDNYDISHCDNGCDPVKGCKQVSCEPNTTRCGDRVVETCSATGVLTTQACDIGCVEAPAPHCAYISPKYLPDVCDAPATEPSRVVSVAETIDTSVDTTCNGGIIAEPNARDICVVRYGTFKIEQAGSWRVTGTRALAIVTDGALRIQGLLDVSSSTGLPGPGTRGSVLPRSAGGGFATKGGDQTGHPGTGGPASVPVYLLGGSAGGGERVNLCAGSTAGGGAATLVSCRQKVVVDGQIQAGGNGGAAAGSCGALGGGAGGYVVLQGVDVAVSGQMFANGGGGGCASGGNAGQPGSRSTAPPLSCAPGQGGTGGVQGQLPGDGTVGAAGGGSMGYFEVYTPNGVVPTLTPSAVSPAFSPTLTVPTR